jgi:phospholipid/cholesterol/gamma-HCH transport system substrate-binding protein
VKRATYVTWSDLRVVLLTVVSLVLLTLGVWFVGGERGLFHRKYVLDAYMEAVSGLRTGAPVRLAGVNVGTVQSIAFIEPSQVDSLDGVFRRVFGDSLGDRNLRVRLSVERRVQNRITTSSTAKIGTIGLLGDKYVGIVVGRPDDPILRNGDIVLDEPPLDYEALIERGAAAVDELVKSISNGERIVAAVAEGQGTLGLLINDDQLYRAWMDLSRKGVQTLAAIESGEGALGRLLNDPTLYNEMVETTDELQRLTAQIEGGQGTIGNLLKNPELYVRMTNVVARADSLLDRIDAGQGTAGRMLNDQSLYERLDKLVVDLQNLIQDIRDNPRKFFNLKVF